MSYKISYNAFDQFLFKIGYGSMFFFLKRIWIDVKKIINIYLLFLESMSHLHIYPFCRIKEQKNQTWLNSYRP